MYKFYDVEKIISIQQVRSNTVANFKISISSESHEYQVFKGARRAGHLKKTKPLKRLNTGDLSTWSLKNHCIKTVKINSPAIEKIP
jgi:hypothetical protein